MTRALILVGGNSRGSPGVRKRAEDFSQTKDVPALIRDHLHDVFAPSFPATARGQWIVSIFAENAQTLSGAAIAQIHRARGACDMSGRLKESDMATLVINGAHDNSLAAGRETAAGIKGARHVDCLAPGTPAASKIPMPSIAP